MDNLDDSENNAKVSDSAYSNSCSNSQSRRSHSSKSTHSGSRSSGSSGYGGKPFTSGSSNQPMEKRKEKDAKKKKVTTETAKTRVETERRPSDTKSVQEPPKEEQHYVDKTPSPTLAQSEKGPESMEIVSLSSLEVNEEANSTLIASCQESITKSAINYVTSRPANSYCSDGFSCVISIYDGVVMYTTSSLTNTLGFPKDLWLGRSFIDFIHPRDRSTFASQITSGLVIPKNAKSNNEKVIGLSIHILQHHRLHGLGRGMGAGACLSSFKSTNSGLTVQPISNAVSTIVCRLRRYRGLTTGFGVKDRIVTYMPFLLKLTFKNISDDDGEIMYLVIQATPFFSAFKVPNEAVINPVPFVLRHTANGNMEYIDPESIQYLGYLPQDVVGKDALQLYHPDDLIYLRQVYETIVKEGGLPRSKPYRMMTQNGNYIKLETEWSSFINPWSKKLEFVIGKHHIIEGPSNPDVFQTAEVKKATKFIEEDKRKQIRESIINILNEGLTRPAEVAKQQMSKRCQDLASFIESLTEDQPKTDDELRVEIQDPDSYYERDSLLGGISPHHEYNDSKSSTKTPLSYNQLNYNENLQRYFESHQPFSYDDYNTVTGENVLGLKDSKHHHSSATPYYSPKAHNLGDAGERTSPSDNVRGSPAANLSDYQQVRLTESLLNKHNVDMEKKLLRLKREARSSSNCLREQSNDNRQKNKERLARRNASFQSVAEPANTAAKESFKNGKQQCQGVKRPSNVEAESATQKHHCATPRLLRGDIPNTTTMHSSVPITTAGGEQNSTHIHPNAMTNVNNMNTFFLGMGIPPQMPYVGPMMSQQMAPMHGMPGMPGIFPVYYTTTPNSSLPGPSAMGNNVDVPKSSVPFPQPVMPCMMYGQPIYGSPFMYSPMGAQVNYPQQAMMTQSTQYNNSLNPLELTSSNYEEACKLTLPIRQSESSSGWRDKKRADFQVSSSKTTDHGSANSNSINRSSDTGTKSTPCRSSLSKLRMRSLENNRTDEESSYSSFYSSFFKTDSGSAEESGSGDQKRSGNSNHASKCWYKNTAEDTMDATTQYYEPKQQEKAPRRNLVPPWMEKVCVTSDLIYRYQLVTKNIKETLAADKEKMSNFTQPSMVNDQLGQLYLDMHLEGVASKLTLEEGITSSSNSEEEDSTTFKKVRRKRDYSKLVMIYDEEAPLPSPPMDTPVLTVTTT